MLGGFDEAFRRCEDADLAIRLALTGGHFVGVPESLVIQKMTQTSDKSLDQLRLFTLLLLERHQGFFDNESLYEFCREWIELKFDWLGNNRMSFARRLMMLGVKHPVLVAKRLRMAMPSLAGNRAFNLFYHDSV
jgi:GT2 family glycosyltransferase